MNGRDFTLTAAAVAIGTLIALAIAGLYLKSQLNSATASNTTVGKLLALFAPASTSS